MVVMPGHLFGAAEEFETGKGTFEEGGYVYASVVGEDKNEKNKAELESRMAVKPLKQGDLVYAKVKDIYDQIALLQFQPAERRAARSTYSYIRIGEVQRKYTENFRDAIRIGDYVKAEVKEIKPLGIYLTMAAPHLGVVRAFCSGCRTELENGNCPSCKRIERRKWAQTQTSRVAQAAMQ
ncbi:exosome complex RNA-binding protein Csl4 [Candidatus Micrarchaeota archaeon]|nr:exosome complex RNA-binding protein Csl4 [Candidatus Micrarchaeota archaeon]